MNSVPQRVQLSPSHSQSSQPYYLRDADTWTKINYRTKKTVTESGSEAETEVEVETNAQEWMKPLVRGRETGLVEIPANWCVWSLAGAEYDLIWLDRYLDDLPPMM